MKFSIWIFIIFIFTVNSPGYSQFILGQEILESVIGNMSQSAISMSGDGKTVAIGKYNYGAWTGHILVFEYNGIEWVKKGNDIIGSGQIGLGKAISLSYDGRVLAAASNYSPTSVTLFKWNDISWEQYGEPISGFDYIESVSLSGDGNRLITGEPYFSNANFDYIGKVSVFENQNENWIELGTGFFSEVNKKIGDKVSISRDGSTIAFGCYRYFTKVMKWDGTNWFQKGNDFVVDGWNVTHLATDLSEDGNRLVRSTAQGYYTSTAFKTYGIVKVHDWNGTTWTQVGDDVTTGNESFGNGKNSVSISDDGEFIAVGDFNKRRVAAFKLSGNSDWEQVGSNLTLSSINEYFGNNVEISSDGQRLFAAGTDKAAVFQIFTDCDGIGNTYTWNGSLNKEWGEIQNWNQAELPGYCDDVIINSVVNIPELDNINITLRSLFLMSNATIKVMSNSELRILNE